MLPDKPETPKWPVGFKMPVCLHSKSIKRKQTFQNLKDRHKIIICLQNEQLSLTVKKLFTQICKETQTFSISAIFRALTEFEYSYLLKSVKWQPKYLHRPLHF